jgi:hypothetical protein
MKKDYNLEELMEAELNPNVNKSATDEARSLIKNAAEIFNDISVRTKSSKAKKISRLLLELSEVK